jgi:hypothetical protein
MVGQGPCQGCIWTIYFYPHHPHAFLAVFLACRGHSKGMTTQIKKCSCQRSTKGVNNALMWAFLFELLIGGGRLSTMGWTIPNFGKGGGGGSFGDSGFGVNFVFGIFFRLMRPMILPGIFESGKKLIWTI